MPAPGTAFDGPLFSGNKRYADAAGPANAGLAILSQSLVINQNGANNVSATFALPPRSQILGFDLDTITAWNSATSATLTVGTAAGGSQYVTGVDVKTNTSPRAAQTFTTAQLGAMENIGNNTSVVATVTVVGATSAGKSRVTVRYVQTPDWMQP